METKQAEFEKALQELQGFDSDDPKASTVIINIGKMTLRRLDEPGWDYAVIAAAMPVIDRFLNSKSPITREYAIDVLICYWKSNAHVTICEHMAQLDPDEFVRSRAVSCLGVYYKGSKNGRVLSLLNSILKDHQEKKMVRTTAYRSLLSVGAVESQGAHRDLFDPTRDVDWQLVSAIMVSASRPD